MKTLTYLAIAFFTAYFFRVQIVKHQINKIVAQHSNEIQFVGSLMPVYCELENIQDGFKTNTNSLTSFTNTLEDVTQHKMPALERTINNIQPYDNASLEVKTAIEDLYQVSASETNELQYVVNSWQQSDGFLDMLIAGFQTYNFASNLENATHRIERRKVKVEHVTENYIQSLTSEMKNTAEENAWFLFLSEHILTKKDKKELKNYAVEQVFTEINKTPYMQSGCAKEQLVRFKNELGL